MAGPQRSVVTIGNFDGVHIGHRQLFHQVRERAAIHGDRAIAVTFDPHPIRVLAPHRELKLLTPMADRLVLFGAAGVEAEVLPFNAELAGLSPEQFVRDILVDRLHAREIMVGDNFRFGHKATGHVDTLITLGQQHDFAVTIVAPVTARGGIVSSTRIRELLARSGNVMAASRLLGRPYAIHGEVVAGRGIGRAQTVPTLNLSPYAELLPKRGVYVTETECGGYRGQSVTNIGYNPTFGETALHLESHYLDAPPADWQPAVEMRVTFLFRIRDEVKFPNVDALRARIGRDIALARKYFALRSR